DGGRLHVDGEVVLVFNPTFEPGDLTNDNPLLIGIHAHPSILREFIGHIDEVDIFNRALSATEIQAIFDAGSAGKCKP
ncbi:MAG: hypothetical protein IIB60_06805, partial [Planctomycetes bacterium]|nr:hypothetical protein [Planctomycetota bacterium]